MFSIAHAYRYYITHFQNKNPAQAGAGNSVFSVCVYSGKVSEVLKVGEPYSSILPCIVLRLITVVMGELTVLDCGQSAFATRPDMV